ncbi:hypothetical protein HMPREF3291_23330 [Bacillus sp. HMSC76G11]|nr:hypothetical protein HMPREF3291_23330 [Bacillus sp. HMSC76G11]
MVFWKVNLGMRKVFRADRQVFSVIWQVKWWGCWKHGDKEWSFSSPKIIPPFLEKPTHQIPHP